MSKYKDVYNDIKDKIKDGSLKPGEFLASESELANEYSYSKDTIRKALSILELEGYIQKLKGKNSLILERGYLKNVSLSSIQTSQELKTMIFIKLSVHVLLTEKSSNMMFRILTGESFLFLVRKFLRNLFMSIWKINLI